MGIRPNDFFAKTFLSFTLVCFLIGKTAGQNTIRKYLSGTDKDHTVEWKFKCTAGRNSGSWKYIPVPSCWEMQGFGTYHYGWAENFKENESGLYQFNFNSDPSWKNKTVRIVFEGSMTDTEVKINGTLAGPIHRGSFYRFKYDITKLIKQTNMLEVRVDKISADTSVNRAERMSDFWVFGGIHRPVYLEILPKQFIDWVAIDAKADGTFTANIYTENITSATSIDAQVLTLSGEPVGEAFSSTLSKGSFTTINTKIDRPRTWNPEQPNLYKVRITLTGKKGVLHTVTEKFGFRTVEFREKDGFYVNNQRVIFKGINRHTFWPTSGRTTSKEISILDVNLIKDMNMNAVRMSHYPPDDHFLDVCDSLGLFVLDELTGWQKKYDTPVGRKLLKEMIMKDVNHPSIIIWDNGNEGGNNHELVSDYALYDPQKRKVIHPWNIFQGTDTQHYKSLGCCVGSLYNGEHVFFPTEHLHGLYDGGHGAGLNEHWQLMKSNPLSAGVFLWVFADEGIVRHDENNRIDVVGNNAPDGIVGPYREKEGSFFTVKEIWSPVVMMENKLPANFDGTLSVKNEYLYTNLDKVKFQYRMETLGGPHNKKRIVLEEGLFNGPDVLPMEYGKIKIPPTMLKQAELLSLKAIDQTGREIYTWSWALKHPREITADLVSDAGSGKTNAEENSNSIELRANNVSITIDRLTGVITNVANQKGTISFNGGPVLAVGSGKVTNVKHYPAANDHVVEISLSGEMKRIVYVMKSNGVLKIDYSYSVYDLPGTKTFDYLGVNFNYPEKNVTGVKYAGRGPYRVWKNRLKGNRFGVWEKPYNNTVTGESWNYPEFKGYYNEFNWVVIETTEQPFTLLTETDNLFLRLYTPEKPKGAKNDNTSPPFPGGDISILHAISPMGTKFDGAENHGQEGAKNKVGWEWISGTIYLDFTPE
jgi:hypothetical protein